MFLLPVPVKNKTTFTAFALAAVFIAWLGNYTDVDMTLARSMYADGAFALRHVWWAETLSHDYMRRLLTMLGLSAVLPALLDWIRPRQSWSPEFRRRLRVVALSAVLVPLVISLLKQSSFSHCPWDILDFGGDRAYVRLFQAVPAHMPAGRCMPAGHTSSALWMMSLAVFWLPHNRRKACLVALSMLGFGFALGWIQQLRGAHFLTHTLWSVWISCAVVMLVYAWVMRPSRLRRPDAAPGAVPAQHAGEHAD